MTERPDCHTCQHRVGVPGDTHSECRHPGATIARGMALVTGAMASPEHDESNMAAFDGPGGPAINVTFQTHGIVNGWATWPMNYDPTWLKACSGWHAKITTPEPAHDA